MSHTGISDYARNKTCKIRRPHNKRRRCTHRCFHGMNSPGLIPVAGRSPVARTPGLSVQIPLRTRLLSCGCKDPFDWPIANLKTDDTTSYLQRPNSLKSESANLTFFFIWRQCKQTVRPNPALHHYDGTKCVALCNRAVWQRGT